MRCFSNTYISLLSLSKQNLSLFGEADNEIFACGVICFVCFVSMNDNSAFFSTYLKFN